MPLKAENLQAKQTRILERNGGYQIRFFFAYDVVGLGASEKKALMTPGEAIMRSGEIHIYVNEGDPLWEAVEEIQTAMKLGAEEEVGIK